MAGQALSAREVPPFGAFGAGGEVAGRAFLAGRIACNAGLLSVESVGRFAVTAFQRIAGTGLAVRNRRASLAGDSGEQQDEDGAGRFVNHL